MTQMIRKQVYIEQRHERLLKRRAKQRGVTEAEIIRQALEGLDVDGDLIRKPSGHDTAAQKALAFMRSLRARRSKGTPGRAWTRESLYDDRIGRWVKS